MDPGRRALFQHEPLPGASPYTPPPAVLDIFIREFDRAHAEGGLFLLTMHPHVIGYRSRIFILEQLIAHIKAKGGAWFATHADIARWCLKAAGAV